MLKVFKRKKVNKPNFTAIQEELRKQIERYKKDQNRARPQTDAYMRANSKVEVLEDFTEFVNREVDKLKLLQENYRLRITNNSLWYTLLGILIGFGSMYGSLYYLFIQ
jgi:predicted solute-binding protein